MWAERTPVATLAPVVAAIERSLASVVPPPPSPPTIPDPVVAVAPLASTPGTVWLDDAPSDRHLLAARPSLVLVADGDGCRIVTPAGRLELDVGPWDAVDALIRALRRRGRGRLFGYLGYELAHGLEALPEAPPDDLGLPVLWLGLYDRWLEAQAGVWRFRGEVGSGTLSGRRSAPPSEERRDPDGGPGACDAISFDLPDPASATALRSRPSAVAYRAAVGRVVERIHAGDLFQTNLCRRLETQLPGAAAWALYRKLRAVSPATHGAFLRVDAARAVLSVSPESFLRVRGRRVVSEPIKGTRRRSGDAAADRRRARELVDSDKDAAELAMIVDLVRNDLGRVCRPGTVRVEAFQELMRLPGVLHARARVAGRLREDVDAVDLLRAAFPAGSITGAPKIQAMAVAAGEEERARGPAMGAIGWIDAGGDLELSVAIRTAAMGGGKVAYHAGCGIVADSDPEAELQESAVKARAFREALRALAE